MIFKAVLLILCVAIVLIGCASNASDLTTAAQPPIDLEKSFAEAAAAIQPAEDEEVWKGIPWETSLWDARKRAAKVDKPIFVWSMDGHPLCHS